MTGKHKSKLLKDIDTLIKVFKRRYGRKAPYTLYTVIWDDGTHKITLSSTIFLDGLQRLEILKPSCRVNSIVYIFFRGKITYTSEIKVRENKNLS